MLPIHSFGLFLSLGVFVASFIVWRQARRRGLSEEKIFDLFLLGIFFTIVGSRIGFVWTHWPFFSQDLPRIILALRYPGMSLPAGLFTGIFAVAVFSRGLDLSGLFVLDLFSLAFSWTAVFATVGAFLGHSVPGWLPVYLFLVATFLAFLSRKTTQSVELAAATRQPGLFFSSYLIFFSLSLLMNSVIYLGVFVLASAFFLVRYRQVLFMVKIKFPANVLTQIRTYLEQKRQETEKRMKDLKKEDPFEDKSRLLDRASDDSDAQSKAGHERVAAIQQQLNLILVQTRKALTKIKIGKYGICESCGKMIDTDRLAAMPTATLCLTCEKKREK